MIVDPDFLDHWKTQMLIDTLDDPCAPLYVIRLWAHCHTRRGWVFDIPEAGIKSICKYTGDAGILNQALVDCEFLHREGRQVTMVGWDEHNASLIANWENGKKGGRPPKSKPKQNPTETHGLPMANPKQTHQEPIRCDEIGLDKKDLSPPAKPDDPIDPNEIANLYNEVLGDLLPSCKAMSKTRKANLRARVKEDAKRRDMAWWRRYFEYIADSPFLTGQIAGKDGKSFRADMGWILLPENLLKIIEGKYNQGG